MNGFVLSPAAQADLAGIWTYTAEHWSEEQADRYILNINEAFLAIVSGSRTGRAVPEIREGYFKLAVGAHLVFYRVTPSGVADIVRVLHQRMDIPERLLH